MRVKVNRSHPDGQQVRYSFDMLDRASRIDVNGSTAFWINYTRNGMRDSIERNQSRDGARTAYEYDPAQRLSSLTQDLGGASTENDLTSGFHYNPANQVTQLSLSNDYHHYRGNRNELGVYQPYGLNQYKSIRSDNKCS